MFIGMRRFLRVRENRAETKRPLRLRALVPGIGPIMAGAFVTVLTFSAIQTATAQSDSDVPQGISHAFGDGPPDSRFYAPFYDPASGSYFQLVTPHKTVSWEGAEVDAKRHKYKGRQGRLAIIKSPKTMLNLYKNLYVDQTQEAWIGLQYFCDARQLDWVNGTTFKVGDYANWGAQWTRDDHGEDCTEDGPNLGVTISPDYNFRWLAWGRKKGFIWYIAEYPAPAKKEKDASAAAKTGAKKAATE